MTKLRKFKSLINQKTFDDFGSGLTTRNSLTKGNIYTEVKDKTIGIRLDPYIMDDNGNTIDIKVALNEKVIEEIF